MIAALWSLEDAPVSPGRGLSWRRPGWNAPARWRWFSQTATVGWGRTARRCSWRRGAHWGCCRCSCCWPGGTGSCPAGSDAEATPTTINKLKRCKCRMLFLFAVCLTRCPFYWLFVWEAGNQQEKITLELKSDSQAFFLLFFFFFPSPEWLEKLKKLKRWKLYWSPPHFSTFTRVFRAEKPFLWTQHFINCFFYHLPTFLSPPSNKVKSK